MFVDLYDTSDFCLLSSESKKTSLKVLPEFLLDCPAYWELRGESVSLFASFAFSCSILILYSSKNLISICWCGFKYIWAIKVLSLSFLMILSKSISLVSFFDACSKSRSSLLALRRQQQHQADLKVSYNQKLEYL